MPEHGPGYADRVTDVAGLRAIYPAPAGVAVAKHISALDAHCRDFLERCPFAVLATSDASGRGDASPRGGPPGFITVHDDQHLLIPDAPGNRKLDTLINLMANPRLALCCFVPRFAEVLRIEATAWVSRDQALRERLAMHGKQPATVLVLRVQDAFLHCAKAVIRSGLWQPEGWGSLEGFPSAARIWRDHSRAVAGDTEAIQAVLDVSYVERLW